MKPNPRCLDVNFQSRDVICYISGGVTYEESFHIYRLNKELQGQARIIVGGNIIHNSRSFLNEILYHRNVIILCNHCDNKVR